MSHTRSQDADLFIYLSWGTRDAHPLLDTGQRQQAAHLAITVRTRSHLCHLLALDSTPNRLHLVCRFPASLSITVLVRIVQDACAEALTRLAEVQEQGRREPPRWERAYTAQTLCRLEADAARDFVCARIAEGDAGAARD